MYVKKWLLVSGNVLMCKLIKFSREHHCIVGAVGVLMHKKEALYSIDHNILHLKKALYN